HESPHIFRRTICNSAIFDSTILSMFRSSHYPNVSYRSLSRMCARCASTRAKEAKTREMIGRMLRVDHAGEFGANKIYEGQHAVLGRMNVGPIIQHMWDQEKEHLAKFDELLPEHRVRPTVLLPLWSLAGYMLGAGTSLLGREGAMACTEAVEDVIIEHYDDQIRELLEDDPERHKELIKVIQKFRDEESEHKDTGIEHNAKDAPFYDGLSQAIKVGCKGAIWLSERV
ncbi:unnamed protein product, partial [Owenia fusiformis]